MTIQPWMLTAPKYQPSAEEIRCFEVALTERNPALLLPQTPKWVFLHWLTEQGFLLHGSPAAGLSELRPKEKDYRQPDDFSNRTGIYAASDGLWPIMYALKGSKVRQMSDMGLRLKQGGQWTEMLYVLSIAPKDSAKVDARALLTSGYVYVLEREGFELSPEYDHPGLGYVQEAHWVNPNLVRPLFAIPVSPDDFPLPVRLHDADRVGARCAIDPWGFPWLSEDE